MALEQVILGFLVERPMHGYELKHRISPAVPRDRQLNDGVLYPLLAKLERGGLIRKKVERGTAGRARHVYRATPRGQRAFADWLEGTAAEEDEIAYDFLLGHPFLHKCMFFGDLTPELVREKLAAQRRAAREKLEDFERIRAGMLERNADPYRVAILDLGIAQQRAKIRWLRTLEQVEAPPTARAGRAGEQATA